ncbi:MAG: MOSC domain-containing protein [Ktedonobacteraceae bacterium]|nr:MOSC domain-containing protein [Ktedonobacteraceae bacterium]
MRQVAFLQSIQVGTPRQYGVEGERAVMERPWKTSFFRTPSTQPRRLYTTHLEGNTQADRKNHGQLDQAVLLYSGAHYPLWQEELSLPEIGPGGFGENFTLDGMSEQTACVADVYALGEARIQVTGPRYPCWKIARRWNIVDLTKRVAATGRTGWYCRVVQEGIVEPGMPLLLVERPYPRWTMALINAFTHGQNKDVALARELIACPQLDEWWQELIMRRVLDHDKGDYSV